MIYLKDILAIFAGYVIGCISTGYYLTLIFAGKDIRNCGSGSTGARNVGRVLGGGGFAATFILDVARGMLAAWTASALSVHTLALMFSMIALVMGHIWPVQLKFRGGKGIAIVIGFMLIFDYRIIALAGLVFVLLLIISRRYEISVFAAIISTPFSAVIAGHSMAVVCGIILTVSIILTAHKQYIIKFISSGEGIS